MCTDNNNKSLPLDFAGFQGFHTGETILVCGCGASLNELSNPDQFITIAVNDVGRKFDPTYLVVLNPRQQFKNDRFRYVEQSRAKTIFTQLDLAIQHPHIVRFKLGQRGGTDLSNPNTLPYTRNSPYVALCLAIHMGAKKIGLIGVDFTDNHFFATTGCHSLTRQFEQVDTEYKLLEEMCVKHGVEVLNISGQSRLTAFTKIPIEEFCVQTDRLGSSSAVAPLNIVSYATTPVAGVPAILARCISRETVHEARCVWARNGYDNGVVFDGDIEWLKNPSGARIALEEADVVIVHNGKVDSQHKNLLADKPIITMAHNYMWNVDQKFVKQGMPGVVVGQYQATLPEFSEWDIVPNPMPLWEPEFQLSNKNSRITICYTPSGKHERFSKDHRLYWHGKGYKTTMQILDRLSKKYPLQLNVIREKQISHFDSLAMKREAHIVIDECVTGSYHRNSLEGLACGCVVVNGVGILDSVADVLDFCSGNQQSKPPFVCADLSNLEEQLIILIDLGADKLVSIGKSNREWMEKYWDFAKQWEVYWEPVLEKLSLKKSLGCHVEGRQNELINSVRKDKLCDESKIKNLSIIIPHGGKERLHLLEATLNNLKKMENIASIIVVEIGEESLAYSLVTGLEAQYIFVKSQSAFHKARAMNIGLPYVETDLFMWFDNDILISDEYVNKAVREMQHKLLDCLVCSTTIRYLSKEDSVTAIKDSSRINNLFPVQTYYSRKGVCGAAVMVRTEFVRHFGGMIEEFLGWGGEDNAWFYKASLLGKAAITDHKDQNAYHLYHECSGGYPTRDHIDSNPQYDQNVELLYKIRKIKTKASFLEKYPPQQYFLPPWKGKIRIMMLYAEPYEASLYIAEQVRCHLLSLFGIDVVHIMIIKHVDNVARGLIKNEVDALLTFGKLTSEKLHQLLRIYSDIVLVESKVSGSQDNYKIKGIKYIVRDCLIKKKDGLRHLNIDFEPWIYLPKDYQQKDYKILTLRIMQPISLIIGNKMTEKTVNERIPKLCYRSSQGGMNIAIAKKSDLDLIEYMAFNFEKNYPKMRRWEMPFALFKSDLSSTMSVLDCTINPVEFKDRLLGLYPSILYRHCKLVDNKGFSSITGVPDKAFDRVICINTLEHLLKEQREILIEQLSCKLKPGGLLIITCEYYFDSLWDRPEILNMGVIRKDKQEVLNGWNKVSWNELSTICKNNGLGLLNGKLEEPSEFDSDLYKNIEPYPHACIGGVFVKGDIKQKQKKKIVISLLTWNTKDVSSDSLRAIINEAYMQERLGLQAYIIVCDNGSIDGTAEAVTEILNDSNIEYKLILNKENKGSSIARNQIIDEMLRNNADYILFTDGDIEIVPFSSFAMYRHMEENGVMLGCVGADSFSFTHDRNKATKFLYSLTHCKFENTNLVAWTQYGMFRKEVFLDGIRFDENKPFDCVGWGFEDNDLAFQMHIKGYLNQRYFGINYLHRHHNSSVRVMKEIGIDPNINYKLRKEYIIKKWEDTSIINKDPLNYIRKINVKL